MTPAPCFKYWMETHSDAFDAVLLDVDGVLVTARRAIPGSRALIEWLRAEKVPFALLTNDGCNSPKEKIRYLRDSGLCFNTDHIVSASHALVELAEERGWNGRLFFMMGELGKPCYAKAAGLRITRSLRRLKDCAGVIVGEKGYDWEEVITGVFNFLLRNPEAPFVVPNPDEYFAVGSGRLHPASGATARFVLQLCRSYGINVEPIYLGKPHEPIFDCAHHHLEKRAGRSLPRNRVVIIGDSLASDIQGGRAYGYHSALVLTGITTGAMLERSLVQPDLVFEAL